MSSSGGPGLNGWRRRNTRWRLRLCEHHSPGRRRAATGNHSKEANLSMIANAPTETISKLRAGVRGRVVTADDAAYDDLRRVFYAMVDPRPAVIVRAVDAADVAS